MKIEETLYIYLNGTIYGVKDKMVVCRYSYAKDSLVFGSPTITAVYYIDVSDNVSAIPKIYLTGNNRLLFYRYYGI